MVDYGNVLSSFVLGRWKISFDGRGRFQIPSEVRDFLRQSQPSSDSNQDGEEMHFYICKSNDKPLKIFTPGHFANMISESVNQLDGVELDDFLFQMGSSSFRVSVDKNGRASVPSYLLNDAKFEMSGTAQLVGKLYYLEIWHKNDFENRLETLRTSDKRMDISVNIHKTLPKADWHSGRSSSRSSRRADTSEISEESQPVNDNSENDDEE